MTISNARLCAVGLFVAVFVSACTASDDLSGAKAAYVAQVDPVCAELQTDLGELGQDPEKQAGEVQAAVERIKAADKPRDDSSIADVHIAALENLYLALQDVHQSQLVKDQPRAERALETARLNNQKAADAAESYGMVACAEEL